MSALPGTTGRRRVYLMRHGHVDYMKVPPGSTQGFAEVPLTGLGRAQARAAGQALSNVRFDVAISSGYPRTVQTLDLVLAGNDDETPPHEIDPDLVEIKGGQLTGLTSRRQISTLMAFEFERAGEPGARMFEGGESFAAVLERASRAVARLIDRPSWHTAIVVAHEGVNRVLLSWFATGGVAAAGAFEQDTACVNVVDFDLVPKAEGQGTEVQRRMIKAVNLTPYNYVKHGMNLTSLEAIFEAYEDPPEPDDAPSLTSPNQGSASS